MNYKKNEIKEHIFDELNNYSWNEILEFREDISELHNNLFNIDYYLIGYYNCRKWLSDEVFNVIEYIKEYEENNFGEVYTDFSNSEKVANMYAYIIGEELLYDFLNDRNGLLELYKNYKRS